jgi:4-hydroxy-2-oxoheptanedioate aldolase
VSGHGDLLASGLLARIRAGETVYGTSLGMGSPVAVEIASRAGFDWLLLDLEHGADGEANLLALLHAAAAGGSAAPLVRVESAARLRIGRALDLGSVGIMLPRIDTADEAREALRWMRYPPEGERGVALLARAGGYGSLSHGDIAEINRGLIGLVQIETRGSVEQAAEIAAAEGADVLFVGPTDLSHALGIPGDFENPLYTAAIDRVIEATEVAAKCAGVLTRSIPEARGYIDRGFRFIGLGSDASLLTARMRELAAELQGIRGTG